MTWLWVILIVAAIGGIIGYVSSGGKKEDAVQGAVGAGMGCGYIILQIFLTLLGLFLLFKIGSWLFS